VRGPVLRINPLRRPEYVSAAVSADDWSSCSGSQVHRRTLLCHNTQALVRRSNHTYALHDRAVSFRSVLDHPSLPERRGLQPVEREVRTKP